MIFTPLALSCASATSSLLAYASRSTLADSCAACTTAFWTSAGRLWKNFSLMIMSETSVVHATIAQFGATS